MKVLNISTNGGVSADWDELYFIFDEEEYSVWSDEEEAYFKDVEGSWNFGFWFTKGELFAMADIDCWYDRIQDDELPSELAAVAYAFVRGLEDDIPQGWSTDTTIKYGERSFRIRVDCLFDGKVEDCPTQYQFDKAKSLAEV